MASLPYPLNRLNNYGRVGMARMPYPPTDCSSYFYFNAVYNYTKSCYIVNFLQSHETFIICLRLFPVVILRQKFTEIINKFILHNNLKLILI